MHTHSFQTFCVFISVAVFTGYVYQLIFYTAIMTIGGRREEKRLNAYVPCIKVPLEKSTALQKGNLLGWRRSLG